MMAVTPKINYKFHKDISVIKAILKTYPNMDYLCI